MSFEMRYARREDGVRTAYAVAGSGPVLILPPGGVTNLEWYTGDTDAHEKFCARLAEHRTLVLYDRHGYGLSDRKRTDFTFDDDRKDLEAVIEAVDAPTVDFFGISWGGGPTLAYSAAHPERVRKMVLYGTGSVGRAPTSAEFNATYQSLFALRRADRDLYNKTQAMQYFPSGTDPETLKSFGRMLTDSATLEMIEQLEGVHPETQSLLSDIAVPALVLHRRGDQVALFPWGQYLARRLPDARFVPLDGDAHFPWVGDIESVLAPTIEFLTADDAPRALAPPERAVQTILFTDLAGSTAMQSRLGDEAAHDVLRAHDAAVRQAISEFRGREVKHTGDGMMTAFGSAADAVNCALTVRRDIETYNDTHVGEELLVRFGLNAGEPIAEDDDLFGLSVTLAARIGDWGEPGQVLVSNVVRELLLGKGFEFASVGRAELKGLDEPVPLYEVTHRA